MATLVTISIMLQILSLLEDYPQEVLEKAIESHYIWGFWLWSHKEYLSSGREGKDSRSHRDSSFREDTFSQRVRGRAVPEHIQPTGGISYGHGRI